MCRASHNCEDWRRGQREAKNDSLRRPCFLPFLETLAQQTASSLTEDRARVLSAAGLEENPTCRTASSAAGAQSS